MKNQTYRMTMLFDFYGEILTERQKEFFDLYYNEDLSLGEIAENSGITRQGVRDSIKKSSAELLDALWNSGDFYLKHLAKALDASFWQEPDWADFAEKMTEYAPLR